MRWLDAVYEIDALNDVREVGKAAQFSPALGTFPDAVFNDAGMLFCSRVGTDHNACPKPVIRPAQPAIDAIRPDIAPFVTARIGLAQVVQMCCPSALQARNRLGRRSSGLRAKQHFERRAYFAR